ncbi:interleukin-34 isoform X5 [Vulpes lagopus]|uniref:interleukin-34 isoform X5 n=1 Tax=Vulpes lagopus TaxID=494514 RepID=UPI001BC921C5|nr:interleukin-34 isoform X5 [Vulpes lagopus]
MPRGIAWLHYLGLLLGMALGNQGLEMWPLTQNEECAVTGFLRDKLQYRNRLQYMKHYFPINYRVSVPYEGVLRMANITRLRARVSQQELRYLWVWVSLSATESVQEVLLEGHPSWKYLEDVHTLLLDVQQSLTVSCAEVQLWPPARSPTVPACSPAVLPDVEVRPQGGSGSVTPECPEAEPEAGATQSPPGQLLPGHGTAVLFLL